MPSAAFTFTKLVVTDLARAERFYRDVFGLEVTHRHASDDHAFGQEEAMLAAPGGAGSHTLIVTRYLRQPCPAAGSAWTGFVVADIEATLAALEQAGGTVLVPVHSPDTHPVKAAVASDPEGHMIEIIEMIAQSWRTGA